MNIIEIPKTPTKSAARIIAETSVNACLASGDIHQLYAQMAWAKTVAEEALELLKPHIIESPHEADPYKTGGIKIQVDYRKNYDFSHDTQWGLAKREEEAASKLRKSREAFLKSITIPTPDVVSGEIVMPASVIETQAIVKCTIPA